MALLSGPNVYSCYYCGTQVCHHDDILNMSFKAKNGRAFLFSHAMNVKVGPNEDRLFITGLYTVADISCVDCGQVLGWKYLRAHERSQKSKEGKFIFEKSKIIKEDWYQLVRHSEGEEMHLDREQAAVVPPPNSAETVSSVDPVVQTDSVAPHSVQTDSFAGHVVQTVAPHVVKPVANKVTTLKFQGVDIRSEHLPILQKVWMKHGDVVKESKIRSRDFIASALASLAKLIVILETNSGKTLTDNQAHYLTSTLSDLQSMCVKVDWLVPFVERALALHKRKSFEAALKELEKAKAKVEELKWKFLEDMIKMVQGFNSNKKQIVSKSMSACVSIDADECLGEGLF